MANCFGNWECHISSSFIETAEDCVFKWYATKIAKRAAKTTLAKAGQIGIYCHDEMERARNGTVSVESLSALARTAFDAVPPSTWQAESHIDHVDVGLPWRLYGKRDLVASTPLRPLHRIWDYKFSSDPSKYMPGNVEKGDQVESGTPANPGAKVLSQDTQMVLYAWAHLKTTGIVPQVGHVQVNINTGHMRRVWVQIPPVELVRQWIRIRNIVLRMHRASQQAPEQIETCGYPGRGPACWMYNRRCEAFDFCMEVERDRKRAQTWNV